MGVMYYDHKYPAYKHSAIILIIIIIIIIIIISMLLISRSKDL